MLLKTLTLLTSLAGLAAAQTTFGTARLIACLGTQAWYGHNVWTTSETACPANGSPDQLMDANGDALWLRFGLYTDAILIEYFAAGTPIIYNAPTWEGQGTLALTGFTNPAPTGCVNTCTTPGIMSFTWNLTDNLGQEHSGTYEVSWDSRLVGKWVRQFLIPPTQVLTID